MSVLDYVTVHDAGRLLNPMLADGQVLGGFAHGVAAALYERHVYDESGNLMTASFVDYLAPTAPDIPALRIGHRSSTVARDGARRQGNRRGQHDERSRLHRERGGRCDRPRRRRAAADPAPGLGAPARRRSGVKPAAFDYVAAQSLEEALGALQSGGEDAKPIAGGQSLVPALNMRLVRPTLLVDLNHAGLDVIESNGVVRIGATVRQAALEHDSRTHPLLREALPHVGHFVTRNRGTVGGSVAHADGAAEIPLCLAALGGAVVAEGPGGRREIARDEFFVTHYLTTLAPGELVVETRLATPGAGRGCRVRGALAAGRGLRARDGRGRAPSRRRHGARRAGVGRRGHRPADRSGRRRAGASAGSGLTGPRARGRGLAADGSRPARLDPRVGRLSPAPDRDARRTRAAARLGAGGMTEITVTVNGKVVVEDVEPRLLLTDFLRHRLGLTGTHVGCEHGVCGACTVRLDGVSVRGCCLLAVQADGSNVETVESLAGDAMLSPLQEAFKRHHALQCGFCTPGILIAADDLLSRGRPSREEIVDMLSGHLCRCTGYAPIVAAIEDARFGGRRVNLARSLLDACERQPELEAFPGIRYGELLPRVARIAGGLGVEPGERVAVVLDNRLETALLYWACQWAGAVCVPLSWRLSEEELAYCIDDCRRGARDPRRRPAARRACAPGALDRDDREISLLLYTSGTTGRPKGVPRSHGADRAGGPWPGAPARLPARRPHPRRDAPLPHDGHPFPARDAPRRRLLTCHRRAGTPSRRCELIERERITSLYLADLFHDSSAPEAPRHDVSSVRALG